MKTKSSTKQKVGNAIKNVSGLLPKQNLFTAREIRKKLLQMNPQIKEDSKYTNPFLYDDVKKWYEELVQ